MPTTTGAAAPRRARQARRTRAASDQPGNSFDYLYWRLSEGQFQKLVSTILRDKFDSVRCYPIGMGDEGIDGIVDGSVIYQVKWTSKYEQNPASWLKDTIDGERAKIRKLVTEKRITKYILVTSVAGTTTGKGTGSIQKLEPDLAAYSREFGIPVECWWQGDVDAEINRMGDGIKWSFQEMLSGSDAIRYLIFGTNVDGEAARMRETMQHVIQAQWAEDSRVRFSQTELDGVSLLDLFVDVHAALISPPRAHGYDLRVSLPFEQPAAAMLLATDVPFTFLIGVPGQGKSTLTQFLCQQHRGAILASQQVGVPSSTTIPISQPRLPLRVELKTYAEWIDGFDPFNERLQGRRRRTRGERSVESYLANLCSGLSGGRTVTVEEVQSLLQRFPTLLVFDGLDEIADPELRTIAVGEVDLLITRMGSGDVRPDFQVVVTSRPNSTNLAEPDPSRFQRLQLLPLNEELQNEYVVRWCDARGIDGAQRSEIRRIFRDRKALDHVAKLADNPMQLAILLYLISRKGDAVPVSRTPLYTSYMQTLLDREVAGGHIGRNAAPQVQEVTAFLGWHMQAGVEKNSAAGTMMRDDLENTLLLYLKDVEATGQDAAELFRVATDRFWALTSKVDGYFEFAVQPVREYFAACFLAEWAGRDLSSPLSKQDVLVQMVGRSYWRNTLRFYAGFASPNELGALRYGLEEAISSDINALETRVAAWTLLADAVFISNPRVQRDVVRLLADDALLILLVHNGSLSELTRLAPDAGGSQLAAEITTRVQQDPQDDLAFARIELLRDFSSISRDDFVAWWTPNMQRAIGGPDEHRWLDFAGIFRQGVFPTALSNSLTLTDRTVRAAAIRAGAVPDPDSDVAIMLRQSVLDGSVLGLPPRNTNNEAGLLLATMRPEWFHALIQESLSSAADGFSERAYSARSGALRNTWWSKLVKLKPEYAKLRDASRLHQRSQAGTTEPWGAPARRLAELFGPSWLAAEIAVAAAAADHLRASGSHTSNGAPFGTNIDYGNLIIAVHRRPGADWWLKQHSSLSDNLSLRTWALALLAAASDEAFIGGFALVDDVLTKLSLAEFEETAAAASRIALNGATKRERSIPSAAEAASLRTRLVLSYFLPPHRSCADQPLFTDQELVELASPAESRWPIAEALARRLLTGVDPLLLEGLSKLGPDAPGRLHLAKPRESNRPLAEAIAREPHRYSGDWLVYAHKLLADGVPKAGFEGTAVANGWVPRVPRYS
ncbi:NACHT domain-containing NTPase [Plantibacter sp. M259]|uniref:NACHT domain-containing protein n=1 Tax=Plantibacter sp. M259 TaxID=2583822 RepID=UPI00143D328E|nr:NACHT domain-containing protein [Plantibacter sp. M259]